MRRARGGLPARLARGAYQLLPVDGAADGDLADPFQIARDKLQLQVPQAGPLMTPYIMVAQWNKLAPDDQSRLRDPKKVNKKI